MGKSVNIDFNKMLGQLQQVLNKIGDFFKHLPEIIKKAPTDEKVAYGAVGVGILFLFMGIVLKIVL